MHEREASNFHSFRFFTGIVPCPRFYLSCVSVTVTFFCFGEPTTGGKAACMYGP
jgi:hypothetical protein